MDKDAAEHTAKLCAQEGAKTATIVADLANASPEVWDVAYATLFLLSGESSYITGQAVAVDGGITELG